MAQEVKIKASSVCFVDVYQKTFGDLVVEVERRHYDDWADIWIRLKPGVELPPSGETFFLGNVASEFDILDVSTECHIEHELETEIDDDDILEEVESYIEEGEFDDWETKSAYAVIDEYSVI